MQAAERSCSPKVEARYHRYMLAMLRNQLASASRQPEMNARTDMRSALTAEIGRLESDPRRVAWQDGIPSGVALALEPYRGRFAASYHAPTNPFELPREPRERFSDEED